MRGGDLIREARRRAQLTQSDLAGRLGTTQSAIARLETGGTEPSFERVARAIRACGFDLQPRLLPADDSDWSVASANLSVDHDVRVRRHQAAVRFAEAGRRAMADARA
ncbi:MAG TPA: helix-turn-helix transcriptional regulator [Actinomycetota bacterium]|nr:helix-turn-helix transcriptional regulator [Actinomycetota bacterium]